MGEDWWGTHFRQIACLNIKVPACYQHSFFIFFLISVKQISFARVMTPFWYVTAISIGLLWKLFVTSITPSFFCQILMILTDNKDSHKSPKSLKQIWKLVWSDEWWRNYIPFIVFKKTTTTKKNIVMILIMLSCDQPGVFIFCLICLKLGILHKNVKRFQLNLLTWLYAPTRAVCPSLYHLSVECCKQHRLHSKEWAWTLARDSRPHCSLGFIVSEVPEVQWTCR